MALRLCGKDFQTKVLVKRSVLVKIATNMRSCVDGNLYGVGSPGP